MDWAFDRLLNLVRKISVGESNLPFEESPESEIAVTNWKANVSFQLAEESALKWCSMTPQQLQTCMSMLKWTVKDVNDRYSACTKQVKYLDPHIAPIEVSTPRPIWTPSPKAGSCLQWAAKQVEQIYDRAIVPRAFDLGPLTCEESGEVAVGLIILSALFEVKQMERAILPYVRLCSLAKTIAKIGLFAPPIFMLLAPKMWLVQLSIPIAGAIFVGRACQLYLRADHQYSRAQEGCGRITHFFALAKAAVYENYHEEAARRERAQAREQLRAYKERFRRARAEMEELRREIRRTQAQTQKNHAEMHRVVAETARNYRKIEELNLSIREFAEQQVRLTGELNRMRAFALQWLQTKAQDNSEIRVGVKVFSPQFIQSLVGLGSPHHLSLLTQAPFAEQPESGDAKKSRDM